MNPVRRLIKTHKPWQLSRMEKSSNGMKVAVVTITKEGRGIAARIKKALPEAKLYSLTRSDRAGLKSLTGRLFSEFDGIIFCMALGIVVRVIAPCLKDKYSDPALVVVDDQGRFAISALSGHEGGANALAIRVANILEAWPVITTASESKKNIVIGIGSRRGVKKGEVIDAIKYAVLQARSSMDKVRCVATIDLKKNESGLKSASIELGIPLKIISSDLIKRFKGVYQRSHFVKEKIGVEGVSEPCALLAGRSPELVVPKRIVGRVTVAVAREN